MDRDDEVMQQCAEQCRRCQQSRERMAAEDFKMKPATLNRSRPAMETQA
jgi:hypothetical protein